MPNKPKTPSRNVRVASWEGVAVSKHDTCRCGCGELADECMTGCYPLAAFTVVEAVGSATQEPCFYCRRGMHDSCISGTVPCRCCA